MPKDGYAVRTIKQETDYKLEQIRKKRKLKSVPETIAVLAEEALK